MAQPNMAQLQNQFNQNQFPISGSGPVQVRDPLGIIRYVSALATFSLALFARLYYFRDPTSSDATLTVNIYFSLTNFTVMNES